MKAIPETLLANVTIEQAKAWAATEEKFTYCIDLLEISAHDEFADAWVNAIENKFEEILERSNT